MISDNVVLNVYFNIKRMLIVDEVCFIYSQKSVYLK